MTQANLIKTAMAIFIFSTVFVACKSDTKTETRDIQLLSDSSAFHNSTSSDTSRMTQNNIIQKNEPPHHSHSNDINANAGGQSNAGSANNTGSTSSGTSSGSASSTSGSSTTQGTQKKGWSKAAQGAVIGGVGGAIGGAIISKKKGTGAAVGAAVGAAGGYIIGRNKDKKDGRVKN